MSIHRYARDSKTSAQRAAAQWQREVDELMRLLTDYARQEHELGQPLTAWQIKDRARKMRRLAALKAENPNESA